jgi:hypothetical protein
MARVAASTSAETSRFPARKAANCVAKSELRLSMRIGMAGFQHPFTKDDTLLNDATANRRQPFVFTD